MSDYHINDSYAFVVYGSLYFTNDTIKDYILLNKSIEAPEFPPSEIAVMEKFLKDIWSQLNTVIKTIQISVFIDKENNATHTHIKEEVMSDDIDVIEILYTPSSFNITVEA